MAELGGQSRIIDVAGQRWNAAMRLLARLLRTRATIGSSPHGKNCKPCWKSYNSPRLSGAVATWPHCLKRRPYNDLRLNRDSLSA